jgi:NADH pyrophosphatase NudC (nudix superfamily)
MKGSAEAGETIEEASVRELSEGGGLGGEATKCLGSLHWTWPISTGALCFYQTAQQYSFGSWAITRSRQTAAKFARKTVKSGSRLVLLSARK